jgi:hypothetical protein
MMSGLDCIAGVRRALRRAAVDLFRFDIPGGTMDTGIRWG